MQKIFAVIALVALLGVASAELTNGSYVVGPKEVANENDTLLVGSAFSRLVSSGSSVLLQGVVNATTIAQKTISTKDLGASDNKTYNQSGFDLLSTGVSAQAYDSVIAAKSVKNQNGVPQVQVIKYKLSGPGATNSTPQDITSFTNNASSLTIVEDSAFVHPGTKRFYVAALLQGAGATTASLILVGVDVSGTGTTRTTLTDNAPLTGAHVSCAGIAGQKNLYCVYTNDTTNIVAAKVDPNTNVTAADQRNVATVAAGTNAHAWSASNSYGALVQTGKIIEAQSSSNNWTAVKTDIGADNSQIIATLPRDDRVAVLFQANSAWSVQYLDRNGTANGTVVSLMTGLDTPNTIPSLLQHSDGSLYLGQHTVGKNIVVGQVWGDTHLAASTLQAIVYACFALVAALFVF